MTEAKHTPGPWHVCEQNPHKVMAAFGPENGTSINADYYADLLEVAHGQPRTYYSPEESLANARLIAAAPDLLDACESYLHAIAGESTSGRSKALAQMKAAIARATGKEAA